MNQPLVSGDFHSEHLEAKGHKALQQRAYETAFEAAQADINAAPKLARELVVVQGKIDALERKLAQPQKLTATLTQPAKAKGGQKRVDVGKALVSAAVAELKRRVKQIPTDRTLREIYPDDDQRFTRKIAGEMLKGATTPATTTSATWAAELVRSDLLGYWKSQDAVSIIGSIIARGFSVPLEFGPNNSLTVPHRGYGDDGKMAPAWVGQNQTVPVVQGSLGSATLNRHKLACISLFSDELVSTSTPNIAAVCEDYILTDATAALDEAMLSADTGQLLERPAGLLAGVTPVTPGAGPLDDLKALLSTMAQFRARRPFFIMDTMTHLSLMLYLESGIFVLRDEMRGGSLLGVPFIVSSNITDKLVIMDGAALYLGLSVPTIDVSSQATVVLASSDGVAPTMGNGSVGDADSIHISDAASKTPPAVVVSTFQQSAQALRIVYPDISWKLISPDAIAHVQPSWN